VNEVTEPAAPLKPHHVAVNVMGARQTLIGFNIAIVSFQIAQLYRISGGVAVPGFAHEVHVRANLALYISLALALVALIALTSSSSWDEVGVWTEWSLIAGDVLMYLSLACSVTGFFAPIADAMAAFASNLPARKDEAEALRAGVQCAAAFAWFLATYVAPIVSLRRSPFPRRINASLWAGYVAVVVLPAWLNAQARAIEAAGAGQSGSSLGYFVTDLLQPISW
jgi:hypothetical protein